MLKIINNYFKISQSGSSIRTEILAGLTTFLTMSYIIFVNPDIMSASGMPFDSLITATCFASAIATLIMGVLANYPIGLAPSMGVNAFFTFGLVIGLGFTWQMALTSIFIEGVIFIILTITNVRKQILDCIPHSLKIGISAGIGLFIAFIGMQKCGIVVKNDATLVSMGKLTDINTLFALLGLLIMAVLYILKVRGSILIGILSISFISMIVGLTPFPDKIVSAPPSLSPIMLKMDFSKIFNIDFIIVTIVLLFMDIFNTIGTLIGAASRSGLVDKDGNIKRAGSALMADAVGTAAGAAMGVSTVTAYVESVTGVEAGGRTGFTAVVIAVLFALSVFFTPIIKVIPSYGVAPALIFVGFLMLMEFKNVDTSDLTNFLPAVITVAVMALTYSITNGIELGIFTHFFLKLFTGKRKEISPMIIVLSILFIIKEIYGVM